MTLVKEYVIANARLLKISAIALAVATAFVLTAMFQFGASLIEPEITSTKAGHQWVISVVPYSQLFQLGIKHILLALVIGALSAFVIIKLYAIRSSYLKPLDIFVILFLCVPSFFLMLFSPIFLNTGAQAKATEFVVEHVAKDFGFSEYSYTKDSPSQVSLVGDDGVLHTLIKKQVDGKAYYTLLG